MISSSPDSVTSGTRTRSRQLRSIICEEDGEARRSRALFCFAMYERRMRKDRDGV